MNIELTNEQATALLKELDDISDVDRYFLSNRIRTLKEIRAKIWLEPVREPLPLAPKQHAPTAGDCSKETPRSR
jgi:hypothetical protein